MKFVLGAIVIVLVVIAISPTLMAWGKKAKDYFQNMG